MPLCIVSLLVQRESTSHFQQNLIMTRFEILLAGYRNDSLTQQELNELLLLLDANDTAMKTSITNDLQQNAFAGLTTAAQRQRLFDNILDKSQARQKRQVVALWRRVAVAAAIMILLGAGTYLWVIRTHENKTVAATQVQTDVLPGGNKAVLTLADGSTIILDSAKNGALAQQGNANIVKTNNGELAYTILNEKPTEVLFNTLATPRGGQYQLVLPDGSKVWLNAASSIRYPTVFTGKERKVEIKGEAYFEVAHDKTKPFYVHFSAAGHEGAVQVLGTHFNVNAYEDEAMVKATLLEGSVKVIRDAASTMLKPGEQAVLSANSPLTIDHSPSIDQVMSWKNGQFYFSNSDIETIMRQMARWYDVEVVYKNHPEDQYTVSLSRNVPVSKLLKYLELSGGVKFKIEGKKIVVM
jgi:ferric-dicitrate binding protein FerR (iron transport regulator)